VDGYDKSKLNRINSILADQFSSLDKDWNIEYAATLKSKRAFSLPSLENLLFMDNSVNDPITSLYIRAKTSIDGRVRNSKKDDSEDSSDKRYYYCDIDFSIQSAKGIIVVSVDSSDTRWSNSTLLALEEQVERTLQRDFWTKHCNSDFRFFLPLMLLMLFIFVGHTSFTFLQGRYDLSERMWLAKDDVAQLLLKSDEKFSLLEVYKLQLKKLQYYDQSGLHWKLLLS
jgi:hypothetical protein